MDGRNRGGKPPGSKSKERRLGPAKKDKHRDFLTCPCTLNAGNGSAKRHDFFLGNVKVTCEGLKNQGILQKLSTRASDLQSTKTTRKVLA
jgi:hypothetical protein